eukprot:192657-Rhodomonas_salina.6
MLKLHDPCEEFRILHDRSMSLSTLLKKLNMSSKSASGAEAVVMAHEKRWEELENYCMQDASLTHLAAGKLLQMELHERGMFLLGANAH